MQQAIFAFLPVYQEVVARGDKGAGLPGHFPAWPRLPDQYLLWHRAPFQCGAGPDSGDAIRKIKCEAVMAGGTGSGLYSGVLNSVHYDTEIAWLTSSGKTQIQFRRFQLVSPVPFHA